MENGKTGLRGQDAMHLVEEESRKEFATARVQFMEEVIAKGGILMKEGALLNQDVKVTRIYTQGILVYLREGYKKKRTNVT